MIMEKIQNKKKLKIWLLLGILSLIILIFAGCFLIFIPIEKKHRN